MATAKTKILLFCLIIGFEPFVHGFTINFMDVKDILKFGYETVESNLAMWNLIRQKTSSENGNYLPLVYRIEKELENRLSLLSYKIDHLEQTMNINIDLVMNKLLKSLPLERSLDHKLSQLDYYVGKIDDLYKIYEYTIAPTSYNNITLQDFAQTCVSSRSGSLPDILKSVHRLLVPSSTHTFSRSILVLLAKQMHETSSQICSENQSLQQLLYNLYSTITLAEIKGYSMIQFSYMLLSLYNQGANFTKEMELVKEQYILRTSETVRAVKTAMAFAPRDIWMCDSPHSKLNETYTQLMELFQGYIVNEVDLNSRSTCREDCAYYSYSKIHGCYKNQYCSQQRTCKGNVINCKYVDSDMWVCPSARDSHRRYEYISYENQNTYGESGTCKLGEIKVDSWWRWLFWHCSYCFCYCDEQGPKSDRYFSLREVTSDTENNKVVTGVKLEKVNHIIHIQIQEGELMPRGNINKTTVAWKPIVPFSILDKNVKNGIDYHTLTWEQRGLDLDDLVSDQNHLITGLRFRTIGSRLNLEIRATPFNFTSGELLQHSMRSYWISNDVTNREELKLENPNVPTRIQTPSLPDSKKEQYVNFSPTDRRADAAQNTIPFIDIQPVQSDPPVPMAGAGIFHKGRSGSGGYVALKLITYDFTPHLIVDLPPSPPVIIHPTEVKVT